MRDDDCVAFLRWALPRMGLRWEGFRKPRGQVCKRIGRRVAELGLEGLEAYRRRLDTRPDEWRVLEGLCRVTISRFFRDRGVWEHLRDRALPELADRLAPVRSDPLSSLPGDVQKEGTPEPRRTEGRKGDAAPAPGDAEGPPARRVLRAWSAGCGSGEEPYSLTILWRLALADRFPEVELRVLATDAGRTVLERARRGCYGRGTLKEMGAMDDGWIERVFRTDPDARGTPEEPLCLPAPYREPVELRLQDLRRTMPAGPFHLVLCRNLAFTYFAPDVQARILEELLGRILPGGRLVLGAHEALPEGDWPLRREDGSEPVWARRPTAGATSR